MTESTISASCHSKKNSTDGHRDHRQHVLEEEDQAVAEKEADALQVDGRARHQLPGLVAVVEAEREPHEVRVEPLAHVHLDRERLLAGNQPPGRHQDGASDAECRRLRPTYEPQLLPVVRRERAVDHVLRDPDQGDRGGLRADREDDRDDQPQLVGAQEPEQTGEGVAVAGGFRHHSKSSRRRRLADARELLPDQPDRFRRRGRDWRRG